MLVQKNHSRQHQAHLMKCMRFQTRMSVRPERERKRPQQKQQKTKRKRHHWTIWYVYIYNKINICHEHFLLNICCFVWVITVNLSLCCRKSSPKQCTCCMNVDNVSNIRKKTVFFETS